MSRRGKGEGSIYRDSDGKWRGYVDLGYGGGRRRRKYVRGITRRDVAAQLRVAATARDAGALVHGRDQTLAEWMAFWLDSIVAARVRPSTLHTYRGYVRKRIVPALGHHRLGNSSQSISSSSIVTAWLKGWLPRPFCRCTEFCRARSR